MFKTGSFGDEIYHSMEKQLVSNQLEDKHGFNKLSKAANYLHAAAEIFEQAGMREEADEITEVLRSFAQDVSSSVKKMDAPAEREVSYIDLSNLFINKLKEVKPQLLAAKNKGDWATVSKLLPYMFAFFPFRASLRARSGKAGQWQFPPELQTLQDQMENIMGPEPLQIEKDLESHGWKKTHNGRDTDIFDPNQPFNNLDVWAKVQ